LVDKSAVDVWAESKADPEHAKRIILRFCRSCSKSPEELLEMQRKAASSRDEKKRLQVLDLVESYVRSLVGLKSSKKTILSWIRSFFAYHRRSLPEDKLFLRSLKSDRERVSGRLTPEILRNMLISLSGDPRKRSMILTQLQSFSGVRELMLINKHYGHYIGEQIKKGVHPIELEMKWGRKQNEKPWRTYLGKDAIEALKEYFEKDRGYPKLGEPVWYGENPSFKDQVLGDAGYSQIFARLLARLGYRPPVGTRTYKVGSMTVRYGLGPHEVRDVAISLSQKAVSQGFNPESADYFAGHTVDPLGYRKLHDIDPEYRSQQYLIVEPFLNLHSSRPEIREMTRLDRLRQQLEDWGYNPDQILKEEGVRKLAGARKKIKHGGPRVWQFEYEWTEKEKEEILQERIRDILESGSRGFRKSSTNGGRPFESKIVSEDELVQYVEEGWDLVKELSNGKIVIRRPLGD